MNKETLSHSTDSIKIIKNGWFIDLIFKDKCMCLNAKHKALLLLYPIQSDIPSNLTFIYREHII
jgi:hypothetical protein